MSEASTNDNGAPARCRHCGHGRLAHLDRYGRDSSGGHECSLCTCPGYLPPAPEAR
jgi:hypothetical protein